MHPDHFPVRYTPTSSLSPRISARQSTLSPPPIMHRSTQSRQATRTVHMDMPLYSTRPSSRGSVATPSSTSHSPALGLHRRTQPTPMEAQQQALRRGQRDFLKQLQLSSTLAASAMTHKPDAPRLDPLGSPKGPVTPLALEQREPIDYFGIQRVDRYSPVSTPTGRSSRMEGSIKDGVMTLKN